MILLAVLVSSAYFKTFDEEHHLCFRYLYAILFGCSVTIVEVASKTSLVGQLVPEKYQAGRWPKRDSLRHPRLPDVLASPSFTCNKIHFCWGKEIALKHFTLSPIIMKVENYPNLYNGNYYWRDPFSTSMIMGGRVIFTAKPHVSWYPS